MKPYTASYMIFAGSKFIQGEEQKFRRAYNAYAWLIYHVGRAKPLRVEWSVKRFGKVIKTGMN